VFYRTLETFAIPAVTYWEPLPYSNGTSLPVELEGGLIRLVEHLVAFGHRRIGVLGSTEGINPEKAVLFLRTVRRYLPDCPEKLIVLRDEPDMRECGRKTTAELLEKNPDVTAIFYLSDSIVLGGMGELSRRKLVVPDDISVASFDNSHLALSMEPRLTSVGFGYDDIAAKLVGELTRRLFPEEGGAERAPESVTLEFYPRRSTGPAHQ
jgi:DNA-binding LacI/PurR family transcriptional regulator